MPYAALWPSCTYCGRRTVVIDERHAEHLLQPPPSRARRLDRGSSTGQCYQRAVAVAKFVDSVLTGWPWWVP